MTVAIETSGLGKCFGTTRALDSVDLSIRRGAVYGLLGPNGAGKTTTINILTTLLRPDAGTAVVVGHDVVREPARVRQKVSLAGQYASVDDELTGQENLVMVGRLLGLGWSAAKRRATELLAAFDLADASRRQVRTYSGGMRRRIDIAASLVSTPEVLFLDEPTTGLDPRSRNQVWDLVRGIAAEGTTVLLTTQYLEEADRLAERLAVIDQGRVIAEGTSRELKASVGANSLSIHVAIPEHRAKTQTLVSTLLGGGATPALRDGVLVVQLTDVSQAGLILTRLNEERIALHGFSLGSPSLDDVFLKLTGRPAQETKAEEVKA